MIMVFFYNMIYIHRLTSSLWLYFYGEMKRRRRKKKEID